MYNNAVWGLYSKLCGMRRFGGEIEMEENNHVYQSWYQWLWPDRPYGLPRQHRTIPKLRSWASTILCPADYLAYMLKYDTMHGQFDGAVWSPTTTSHHCQRQVRFPFLPSVNPADMPWGKLGAEYVVESTGLFLTQEKAAGSPGCRRQEGCHVRPLQGRYPHVCLWRQPG